MEADSTVVVVDDDAAMRNSLRWLLQSAGLKVKAYASAEEFLDAYGPSPPSCLIADVRLPGMSGLELQQLLAARHSTVPVIMITAFADEDVAERALQAGAIDLIEKPFSDQVLLDRIRRAIATRGPSRA